MTTKSSIRTNNMSTNGNEIKSSRIYVKRPLNTTNYRPNNSSTNGFSNHLKKRTLQLNNFFNSKIKPFRSNEQTSTHRTPSPPLVFHAIAPASPDDVNSSTEQNVRPDEVSRIDSYCFFCFSRIPRQVV